jgi:hypothetical protein
MDIVTVTELMNAVGATRSTICNHIRRGILPATRIPGITSRWRISRADATVYASRLGATLGAPDRGKSNQRRRPAAARSA